MLNYVTTHQRFQHQYGRTNKKGMIKKSCLERYLYFYSNGKIVIEDKKLKEYNEFKTFEELKEYLDSINS